MMSLRLAVAAIASRARRALEPLAPALPARGEEGPGHAKSAQRVVRARVAMHAAASLIALALAASPAAAVDSTAARHPKAALDLNADGSTPDRVVKSGTRTSVATVWDCALPNMAPVVSARVEHGTVAVVKGEGPNCGRPQMSLTMILYRPTPGFRGTDTLTVLGFLTQGDIDQTFTILVK
jgi:hypothetical protein